MTKGSGYNKLKLLAYGAAVLGILLCFFYIYVVFKYGCFESYKDFLNRLYFKITDNPGDFIGGTSGILFTLTATIFLFITFTEQREQFEKTQKNSFYSRFEATYFNILGTLSYVKKNVNEAIAEFYDKKLNNLDDFYNLFVSYYRKECERNAGLRIAESQLLKDDVLSAEIQNACQAIGDVYTDFIKDNQCNVGYYFRYIYNTIKFVCDKENIFDGGPSEVESYVNLLQAQLSDKELSLLFYDAISEYGENKEGKKMFREMLDKTHFLENIKESVLLSRYHHLFYPKTYFKFMNYDDECKVKKIVNAQH